MILKEYSTNSVYTVGVLVVCLRDWAPALSGRRGVYGRQLLCAGVVLGEGRVAPVYAKRSVAQLLTEQNKCVFITCPSKSFSGLRDAPGLPDLENPTANTGL